MKRKIFVGFKALFFIPLFLIITKLAFAEDFWPIQVGSWYEYNAYDSANPQNTWTARLDFGSKTIVGSQEYFNVTRMDSLGDGTVLGTWNWYARVTADALYSFGIMGNNSETLDFQAAPKGTTWSVPFNLGGNTGNRTTEIFDIKQVTVPYGTFNNAYIYKTYFDPESIFT
jgi:hypothetical protein